MRRFIEEHKLLVFIIVAVIAAIIILSVFNKKNGDTGIAERVAGDAVTPVQSGATGIGGWFASIGGYFGDVKALKAENDKLKAENTGLQKQINDMHGLDNENLVLREMLDLKRKQTDLTMVAASIAARNPSDWRAVYTINKGSASGIKKNQAVVNSKRELVGMVSRTGDDWAEVITIIDPDSSISGLIRRSNEIGVVEGTAQLRFDGSCKLGYIERDADIKVGDFVETSGYGGVFPKGIIIGKIIEIYEESATMSGAAIIQPSADVRKTNEVFVITDYKDFDISIPDSVVNDSDIVKTSKDSDYDEDED